MSRRKIATKARQPARDINRTQKILAAQQLRIAGYEWAEIATQLGIKGGKGAAYHLVNNALIQALREGDAEMREMENLRLNALHRVYWPKAMEGDGWSHDRILQQMQRRAALNGLDITQPGASSMPIIFEVPQPLAAALRGGRSAPAPIMEAVSGSSD